MAYRGIPFENGFDLTLRPERLLQPLEWKRASNDLREFHERSLSQRQCSREYISKVFDDHGKGGLAYLSGADEAQFALMQKFINERYQNGESTCTYVVWRFD